jgi:DNA primase
VDSLRLSDEFRRSLESATEKFEKALSEGVANYLLGRGIDRAVAAAYRLGTVDASATGFSEYEGMLSIPYLTPRGGVCALKFRRAHDCDAECDHAKYLTPHETRLYNTKALDRADLLGHIAICEGEINAITLEALCGIPAVGVPGVKTWTAHPEWVSIFRGYRRVLIFQDDDEPGRELAKRIAHDIDTAEIVRLPANDANATYLGYGPEEIRIIAKA